MKRKILMTLGAVFGLGLLVSTAWVGVTHATDVRTGNSPTLASSETTDSSLYVAGENILVAGTVKGDLFCAGSNINITGTVEGDVICAGQAVRVSGRVSGDIRAAGQSVEVLADVAGSVTAFGESVIVSPEAKIGRDLTLGASRGSIEGSVGRDVLGGAATLTISGQVGRSVDAEVSALTVDSRAKIGGDLNYTAPTNATVASGSMVQGQIRYTHRAKDQNNNAAAAMFWGATYGFVAMLIIGLAGLLVAPRGMDALGAVVRTRPVVAFAAGAALLLVGPAVGLLLMFTIFGIPLGVIVFLLWTAGLMASFSVGSYAVGWMVVEKLGWPGRGRRYGSLLIGLVLGGLVGLIPLIGGISVFLVVLAGFGSMAVTIGTRLYSPKKVAKAKAA